MEAFKCDIAGVLQNDDRTVLQKLAQSCREFRSCVAAKIGEELLYEKGEEAFCIYQSELAQCNNIRQTDTSVKMDLRYEEVRSLITKDNFFPPTCSIDFADCTKQAFDNTVKMSELQKKINTVETNMDNIAPQQKVIDRKITDVIKSQESLQKDLYEAKAQKETLSEKIMDLQLGKCIYLSH